MTFTVDRRIAELLCSRICHELVAGVAAINNGVELISEIDPSMFDEAMTLIGSSAKQASARVQYYRMAYGFAGHDALSSMAAVGQLISQLVETEDRYGVELPENAASIPLEAGRGKKLSDLPRLVSIGVHHKHPQARCAVSAHFPLSPTDPGTGYAGRNRALQP